MTQHDDAGAPAGEHDATIDDLRRQRQERHGDPTPSAAHLRPRNGDDDGDQPADDDEVGQARAARRTRREV